MASKGRHKNLTRKQLYNKLRPYLRNFPTFDSAKDIFLSLFTGSHAMEEEPQDTDQQPDSDSQQDTHPVL